MSPHLSPAADALLQELRATRSPMIDIVVGGHGNQAAVQELFDLGYLVRGQLQVDGDGKQRQPGVIRFVDR